MFTKIYYSNIAEIYKPLTHAAETCSPYFTTKQVGIYHRLSIDILYIYVISNRSNYYILSFPRRITKKKTYREEMITRCKKVTGKTRCQEIFR